jgi:hypothetical protein
MGGPARTVKKSKPRLFVTGGSGFLAINWACAVRDSWDVILATHRYDVALVGVTAVAVELGELLYRNQSIHA